MIRKKTAPEIALPALNDTPSYDAPEPPPEPVTEPPPEPAPEPKRAPRNLRTAETVLYRHLPTKYRPTGCYGFGTKTTSMAADNGGVLPAKYLLKNTSDKNRAKVGMCNCDPAERFTIATRHDNKCIVGVFRGARHADVPAIAADRLNRLIQMAIENGNATDGEWIDGGEIQMIIRGAIHQEKGAKPPTPVAEMVWAESWGLLK